MNTFPAFLPALPLPASPAHALRAQAVPRMSLHHQVSQRARADLARCADALSNVKRQAAQLGRHSSIALVALAAASLVALPSVWADVPSKAPSAAFFDETSSVAEGSVSKIEDAAASIFRDNDVRVRIAVVKNMPYQGNINDYARELAAEWGLGPKEMLFVATPQQSNAGVFMGVGVNLDGGVVKKITDKTFASKAGGDQIGGAWLNVCSELNDALKAAKSGPGA